MPGDPLIPPTGDPLPEPSPRRARSVVCEFCQCPLNQNGQSLELSPRALQLRDLEDDLRAAKRTITELKTANDTIQAKLTALDVPVRKRSALAVALADDE